MNKEKLALAIIIVCLVGAIVGLTNTFITGWQQEACERDQTANAKFLDKVFTMNKIALISLNGIISDSDADSSFFPKLSTATRARKYLYKAKDDKSVKAVVLRINSPGGTVATSQEVYNAVMECRKEKPVVVSMGDVAASGGYYIASGADVIVANKGTITGSIGVIISTLNFAELMDKVGVKDTTIKSGEFKDIISAYRPTTEKEKKLLQALVDDAYQQFLSAIKDGRVDSASKNEAYKPFLTPLDESTLKKYADGRIFSGQQAQELGFVDKVGDIYEAKNIAISLAQKKFKGVKDTIPMEPYDKPDSLSEYLMEASSAIMPNASRQFPYMLDYPKQPLWLME